MAVAVGITLVVMALNLINHEPSNVGILRPYSVEHISEYLTSAYRDEAGQGTQFVGRVDKDWLALSVEDRRKAATEMIEVLKELGVNQALVYDHRMKLQVHFAGNETRIPKPAGEPAP